jgi:CubicO group peptidase (beta-lactamase class C family)
MQQNCQYICMKGVRKKILLFGGLAAAAAVLLWESFPLISGYGAKVMCSAVFVAGRDPAAVNRQDLGHFPFSLGQYEVSRSDSSVTASIWGFAQKRAIYRRGLGATLVNGIPEEQLRTQVAGDLLVPPPAQSPDTLDWPQGDRPQDTILPAAIHRVKLAAFLNNIFFQDSRTGHDSNGTRAVVAVYDGRIIGERYAAGFGPNTPLAGWSMTKGVTNALLGILVRQGRLDIRQPAPVAAWQADDRRRITITHLMHMRSGLRWWEFYGLPDACTRMLFGEKDMGGSAARSGLRHPPGEVFNYSSGTANILSGVIRKMLPSKEYYRWPYEELFYRIGMYHTVLEPDAGGTFVGSSYCYATARDWARFGLLYLYDGVWMGQRVLPEGWVKFTRTGEGYGALWWLNHRGRWPDVPPDCFFCEGYEGQYIWVIPSRKLVVVRLALQRQRLQVNEVLKGLLAALPR